MNLKNFTKYSSFQSKLKLKQAQFEERQPDVSLSQIVGDTEVPRRRREFFNKSDLANPKLFVHANKAIRKQAS